MKEEKVRYSQYDVQEKDSPIEEQLEKQLVLVCAMALLSQLAQGCLEQARLMGMAWREWHVLRYHQVLQLC